MVDDETLFRTMEVASKTGALVMVHAENGDVIDVLVKRGARGRQHRAALPRAHAAARGSRARRRTARSSSRISPARRSTSSTSRARRRSSRSRSRARRAGTSGARRARSISSSTVSTTSRSRTSRAPSTCTRRRVRDKSNHDVLWNAVRTDALSVDLDRPLRLPVRRPEDARQGRLLEDPERRPGPREPAADDPRVRRPRRPDHAQPHGRAARDESGEALRPLSAQGNGRGRLRRRPRHLRPGEAGDDLGGDAPLEVRLQPLRGNARSPARPRSCCCAGTCSSRTTSSSRRRGSASSSRARASARSSSPTVRRVAS